MVDQVISGGDGARSSGFPHELLTSGYTGSDLASWQTSISREEALDFGRRHFEAMAAYRSVAAKFGGGFVAGARAILADLVARGAISNADHERLSAIFDAFGHEDLRVGFSRVIDLHQAASADAEASALALACSAVGAASAQYMLERDMTDATGGEVVAADMAGTLLGGLAGPLGAISAGLGASLAVGGI